MLSENLEAEARKRVESQTFIVATSKPWNMLAFERRRPALPRGHWVLVTRPEDLALGLLEALKPRYIFFPHWSWIVPQAIVDTYECVCFHMTDVPYGRGGSPLQNLIVRGHSDTKITALRMVRELDAGPVYKKMPLSLEGSARTIFQRASEIVLDIIRELAETQSEPVPQSGPVTSFVRRKPHESRLPDGASVDRVYDHIRMLDAEGYPRAFLDYGHLRLTFEDACRRDGEVTATVRIRVRTAQDE